MFVSASMNSFPAHMVDASEFICGIYWHTSPIDAHQVIWACGIYVAFEAHILQYYGK